jgi:hypothetical protein
MVQLERAKQTITEREVTMIELLDQQTSLSINQWKIFTACLLSIRIALALRTGTLRGGAAGAGLGQA